MSSSAKTSPVAVPFDMEAIEAFVSRWRISEVALFGSAIAAARREILETAEVIYP